VYRQPQGPGVRVDSGVYWGYEVPIYYDPMIAKLVVWGRDREEAMARATAALEEYQIVGIVTTIEFHRRILEHPEFRKGNTTTDFIPRYMGEFKSLAGTDDGLKKAIALAAALYSRNRAERHAPVAANGHGGNGASNWQRQGRVESTMRWPMAH